MTTDVYYRSMGLVNFQNTEKKLPFKTDDLIGKMEYVSLPPGDYRTLEVHVNSEKKVEVKSEVVDTSEPIKYYLFDENGKLIHYSNVIQYTSPPLVGSSCSTFYLLLVNPIEPDITKKVCLQIDFL